MAGVKGKSGGPGRGQGRHYESITLRIGDQFYAPMRGLAEVVAISANEFKLDIDGEHFTFTARSRPKSKMSPITRRAMELWNELPDDVLGRMPHSYIIRCQLYTQFPDEERAHVSNCSIQAIRMLKQRARGIGD